MVIPDLLGRFHADHLAAWISLRGQLLVHVGRAVGKDISGENAPFSTSRAERDLLHREDNTLGGRVPECSSMSSKQVTKQKWLSGRPTVMLNIEGNYLQAFIDTGSHVTLINNNYP